VMFSVNGMETAFMLFFVAWQLWLSERGWEGRGVWLGLCWAGVMWTRPDGFIYIAVLGLAHALFGHERLRRLLRPIAVGVILGAVLYLPWFVAAWQYYSSPVPHTVIAKSNVEEGALAQLQRTVWSMPWHLPGVA